MTMRKILLSLFAIVIAISASAQTVGFGPRFGFNAAMLTDKAFDPRYNFNVGAFVEYDLCPAWSLEMAGLYSRQGATHKHTPITLTETRKATLCLDYINVPLVAKYYPWMGLNIFLGPQFSYLINAEQKIKDMDNTNVKSAFNKFDISAVLGVGYTWECGMVLALQYNCGLKSIYKDKDAKDVYNGVLQMNMGWRF